MVNLYRNAAIALGTLGFTLVSTAVARADVLAAATRTKDFSSASTSPVTIPINDSDATTLTFKTTVDRQRVVIIYNAECQASGNVAGDWLTVSILVDGNPTNPNSGTDFAMCTSNDLWTAAVRQSVYVVPKAGYHHVTVVAQGLGTTFWRLDDSSLVVEK
jgi:hypothetical protein